MKKIIKIVRIFTRFIFIKPIRVTVRRIVKLFPQQYQYKLRGLTESFFKEEIIKSKKGFYYSNRSIVGLYADIFGTWDDMSFLKDYIKEPKTIIEVGANIGLDTVFMAKIFPNCQIIAIEPVDKYRELLIKNVEENNIKNILIYDHFISSNSGSKKIYITSSSASAIKNITPAFPTIAEQDCRSITLDDFCEKNNIKNLDFLKTDTDGYDHEVLKGGENTLNKFKPYLMVEFSGYALKKVGSSKEILAKLLYNLGYDDFLLLYEKNKEPMKIKGYDRLLEHIQDNSSVDVFAIPNSRAVNFKT